MGFDLDDDILQDFLIEAAEILEQLQAQLVDLEQNPTDRELLNAIFRGFHTVKGGAGFLSLNAMVDVCHGAENVFDLLRNDKLNVSASLMDVVLNALDTVNAMFGELQSGVELTPAEPALLAQLERLCSGEEIAPAPAPAPAVAAVDPVPVSELVPELPKAPAESAGEGIDALTQGEYQSYLSALEGSGATTEAGSDDDISDDEFESLLDQLHGKGQFSVRVEETESETPETDDISDDEFEALLDQLHGSGRFGEVADVGATQPPASEPVSASSEAPASADELINDDEFEALLDQLHGKGTAPGAAASTPAPAAAVQAEPAQAKPDVAAAPAAKKAQVQPQGDTTVRVDTRRLDDIMNMVGELVLVRNRLVTLGLERDDEEMAKALASLDIVTSDLQGGVMKTRMQPIKKVFGRFPRVVRDLARSLNKEIQLQLIGEETDLDKNLVEALADPLVHLVRNSVDHGIEMPDVRESIGKTRQGTIVLSAAQEGDHIQLEIRDDGGGMNAEKLKQIAIDRGVIDADAASRMSDVDAYNLIFAPGFSTKTEISDISGRGVGMDVVKTRIAQLNGSVSIDSSPGEGTVIQIKVPLTLAIMPTLMVEVAGQVFALPLACVNEIFHMDLAQTNVVDGQLSITIRERAIPLFYLDKWLVKAAGRAEREGQGHVVIVHIGNTVVGFVVDALIGQEEVVIKPLGSLLHGTPGVAGATITSNGGIALILDVPGMLKHYARRR
ncbi:chemotaxis protein CheA [Ferrimonas balearica]|uniref:chemotaxis protein CheA n=1 Tax=Ferrimonas balearica TaxID=44012 RepID=UPI001C99281E|nr:chemotaxis protein CheA [Ferrimonas balearica]MBY5921282.1 chemotaxis protein CheA [Ferrimonas balearica]MBY5996033.1 chemotaxis protein CheA [Ferrimonas balearica]